MAAQVDKTSSVRCAILVGVAPTDLCSTVAGLSPILRSFLLTQEAGFQEVHIVEREAMSQIPLDARLNIRVTPYQSGAQQPAIVCAMGTIWHASALRRLVAQPLANDEFRLVRGTSVVLCAVGAGAVEDAVRTMTVRDTTGANDEPDKEAAVLVPLQEGEFVARPRTREERVEIERLLLRSLFKPIDGMVSRHLNRRVSLSITRQLLNRNVTPNQMTVFAGIIGLLGVVAIGMRGSSAFVWGALALEIQNILDGCDGEIARLKYLKSSSGEWLDQVFDDVINAGFLWVVGSALEADGFVWARGITVATIVLHTAYQLSLYLAFWKVAGGRGSVAALQWWGQQQGHSASDRDGDRPVFLAVPVQLPQRSFRGTPQKNVPLTIPIETRMTQLRAVSFTRTKELVVAFFSDAAKRDFFCFLYLPCSMFGLMPVAFFWHAFVAAASGAVTTAQWIFAGGPKSAS